MGFQAFILDLGGCGHVSSNLLFDTPESRPGTASAQAQDEQPILLTASAEY